MESERDQAGAITVEGGRARGGWGRPSGSHLYHPTKHDVAAAGRSQDGVLKQPLGGVWLLLAPLAVVVPQGRLDADWLTYGGSLSRSGCVDGVEVAPSPAILWTLPGKNHYLASPAPSGERIFFSALGAYNTPVVLGVEAASDVPERVSWTQRPPALRQPSACSPVVVGEMVIFGEGMHQNAAGAVSAFSVADGLPLWRIDIPGELRHVEGSPAIFGHRMYFGCGSEGVVCVDFGKIRLRDQELTMAQAESMLRQQWKELLRAYEVEKKNDPDFAVPPSLADLEVGKVARCWTAGKERWHVDAPLALAGDRLVAGSAYLDHEKRGERALLCLAVADGAVLWRVPLSLNPWGAPSVARPPGKKTEQSIVLVGCSSIRFDPARLADARGEVVAADVETGKLLWRWLVPGGVLSPVAIDRAGQVGLFTATDGKVRALKVASGELAWTSEGPAPFFAAPTLAGTQAYVADLQGGIRALEIGSGRELWRRHLGGLTGLSGRVYATPLCAGGRLFVATCNIEGPHAGAPTVVACLGSGPGHEKRTTGLVVDRDRRRVVVDATIAPRKLPHLDRVYPIEVIASSPSGKKAHETIFTTDVQPSEVHRAMESLGLIPGRPGIGNTLGSGPEVKLSIEIPALGGLKKRLDVARTVADRKTGLPLDRTVRWYFTGSSFVRADPNSDEEVYGADFSGTLVTVYPVTSDTVFQSSLGLEEEALLDLETAPRLPPVGTRVKLVIEALPAAAGEN